MAMLAPALVGSFSNFGCCKCLHGKYIYIGTGIYILKYSLQCIYNIFFDSKEEGIGDGISFSKIHMLCVAVCVCVRVIRLGVSSCI